MGCLCLAFCLHYQKLFLLRNQCHCWISLFLTEVWRLTRKMLLHTWCYHRICSYRKKDFWARGPIVLLDLGTPPRACTILVTCVICVIMIAINGVVGVQFLLIASTACCSDDKIKLWLFLPGNHTSVVEKAQPAISRLRGIFLWVQNMELFIVYSLDLKFMFKCLSFCAK